MVVVGGAPAQMRIATAPSRMTMVVVVCTRRMGRVGMVVVPLTWLDTVAHRRGRGGGGEGGQARR